MPPLIPKGFRSIVPHATRRRQDRRHVDEKASFVLFLSVPPRPPLRHPISSSKPNRSEATKAGGWSKTASREEP